MITSGTRVRHKRKRYLVTKRHLTGTVTEVLSRQAVVQWDHEAGLYAEDKSELEEE